MKKSYSKPMADIEVFSVESITQANVLSVANIKPKTDVKFTKGKLNF